MFKLNSLIIYLMVICCCQTAVFIEAAKILGIFVLPQPAKYTVMAALVNALNDRGHQITLIIKYSNPVKLNDNISKILIEDEEEISKEFSSFSSEYLDKSFFPNLQNIFGKGVEITSNIIKSPEVSEIMKQEQFDMIMLDTFMSEALYGLGEYFNAPMVGISNYGTLASLDLMVGNVSPLSFIPSIFIQHTFDVTFTQRCLNVALHMVDLMIYELLHLPHQRKLYGELFPNATLSFDQANRNFSLILLNQHFSLSFPRPYVPNMIEVAGLHIEDKLEKLPLNVEQFLDESAQGVIYFNLGISQEIFKQNPSNALILLQVFKNLNYNVIWNMDYMPPEGRNYMNILHVSNVSHYSFLAHPQVKLFITNGELLSIIDTVHYAKPILGIPMFADQHINIIMAIKLGYGLGLTLKQLNETKLKQNILELLNNERYLNRVRELSRVFHDQPMKAKDKAIYWIEYVLRYKGAIHLRVKGRFLNFWQFYNIDVLLAFLTAFALIVLSIWIIMKFVHFLFSRSKNKLQIKLKAN